MSKYRQVSTILKRAFVAMSMLFPAASLFAAGTWTFGNYDANTQTLSPQVNVLRGLTPVKSSGVGNGDEGTSGVAVLTDGILPTEASIDQYSRNAQVSSWGSVVYSFDAPIDVIEVRIYTMWKDDGRDDLHVSTIHYRSDDGDNEEGWTAIPGSGCKYSDGSYMKFGIFKDALGVPLATGVKRLRVVFDNVENGWVGVSEIEAVADIGLRLSCSATGSADWTGSGSVSVSHMPLWNDATHYMLTTSDVQPDTSAAGWRVYTLGAEVDDLIDFGTVADEQSLVAYCWLKNADGSAVKRYASKPITVSLDAPQVQVKSFSADIDPENGYQPTFSDIDDGTTFGASGTYKTWVEPSVIYSPGPVTLYAMNAAGLVSQSSPITITADASCDAWVDAVNGDDTNGDGTASAPWKTITKAISSIAATVKRINVKPGTYDTTLGETFPIAVPDGVVLRGTSTAADVIIDGKDSASHVLVSNSRAFELRNATIKNSTEAAVYAAGTGASLVLRDCVLLQDTERHNNDPRNIPGAISVYDGASIEARDCVMRNMNRDSVIYYVSSNADGLSPTSVSLFGCSIIDNYSNHSTIDASNGWGCSFHAEDCLFARNEVPDGVPHDAPYSCFGYFCRVTLSVDRCVFDGNVGGGFMGLNYMRDGNNSRGWMANCLIRNTNAGRNMFSGYEGMMISRNCTFVGNSGGYVGRDVTHLMYNCIIFDDGGLSFPPNANKDGQNWVANTAGLRLHDTMLWDYDEKDGYNIAESSNVIVADPLFRDAENGDYSLLPYSPAVDAGSNADATGDADVAGNARIADNRASGTPTVDIGCYESLLGATTDATFTGPVPGRISCFRGKTYQVPVSIIPAVSGTVTASVAYGSGLTGSATLVFTDGSATLAVTAKADGTADFSQITFTDAGTTGVKSGVIDVIFGDVALTVGGSADFYVATGKTLDIPVAIALDGGVAPEEITLSVGTKSGDGSNTVAWQGEAKVVAGASTASGTLRVTGGVGVNEITISGAKFVESGSSSVTIRVYGYSGGLYVDPAYGVDAFGKGSVDSPLATVRYALGKISDGESVFCKAGTYTAATENFPLRPGSKNVEGWSASGVVDPESVVFTGGNTVDRLFIYESGDNALLANMKLCETKCDAVRTTAATLDVTNSVFTQSVQNFNEAGAIHIRGGAHVTACDTKFSNMSRVAAVYCERFSNDAGNIFTTHGCTFAGNYSEVGTVAAADGIWSAYRFYDTVFVTNRVNNERRDDAYRSTVAYNTGHPDIIMERCKVFGNSGGTLLGIARDNGEVNISNSLFAGNDAPGSLFLGYYTRVYVKNCTFTGNTGGLSGRAITTYVYNSIVSGDGALRRTSGFWPNDWATLHVYNTLVYNTPHQPEGKTAPATNYYDFDGNADAAEGATYTDDPQLKQSLVWSGSVPEIDWDNFSAKPTRSSPAVNVGNITWKSGDYDLEGTARLKDTTAHSSNPRLDLGAYEIVPNTFFAILIR